MRLLFIAVSIFLASCYQTPMRVDKGTFQATKPPNIYGNNRSLEKKIKRHTISYDANIGKNKTIALPEITNRHHVCINDKVCLYETPADINYRLIENTLGFQYSQIFKFGIPIYIGGGVGAQNFPYTFFTLGYNGNFMEVGGTAYLGLALNKASYEGTWSESYWDVNDSNYTIGSDCYSYYNTNGTFFRYKDVNMLHTYSGGVVHTSFFVKNFALNYAVSVSFPWTVTSIPYWEKNAYWEKEGYTSREGAISFSFPLLLMQDIGISYTPHKIQYRLGVNQITGVKFPGQYWGLSVQVAYGW
ncbi:MAG: hypothetical protein FWC26_11725 [Fibromonadales bacterium]|nr:hypothetical protein [Fibromonadales bacterium]